MTEISEEIGIPFTIARHNIAIPINRKTRNQEEKIGTEYVFENNFAVTTASLTHNMAPINTTDLQNLIAILNYLYTSLQKYPNEAERIQTAKAINHSSLGVDIPIAPIIKWRGITKEPKAYQLIKSSALKYNTIAISATPLHLDSKGKDTYEKTHFHFLDQVTFAQPNIGMQCIRLKPNVSLTNAIAHPKRAMFFVNRKIFNSLEGIALNLFIYFTSQSLDKTIESKDFRISWLVNESRYLHAVYGKKRPDQFIRCLLGDKRLKGVLNTMIEKEAISKWEKIKFQDGGLGIKVFFNHEVIGKKINQNV